MSARRPAHTRRTARPRLLAVCRRRAHPEWDRADVDGQRGRHQRPGGQGRRAAVGPVRRGDGPRGRQDDIRPGWPRHGPVQATGERSLGGRWRGADGPPGRPPVGQGDPRRSEGARADRLRPAEPSAAVGPADLPYLDSDTFDRASTWPRPSIRAGSSARSSASCRTGSCPTARPGSTGRSSRPSPTSGSGRPATAASRRRTATARRRSAGAAGRARR